MIQKENSIIDELPIWDFDGPRLVFSDGSFGAAFLLKGIDISSATCEQINQISQELENLICSAAEGMKLQFFYKMMPSIKTLISNHESISKGAKARYSDISNARSNFLRSIASENGFFSPEIYFFLRSKAHKLPKQGMTRADAKFRQLTIDEYKSHKENFERSANQIEGSLHQIGLKPTRLTDNAWFEILFEYFNLGRAFSLGKPELSCAPLSSPLVAQLILSDISASERGIKIGDYYFQSISLKLLPEVSFASMIEHLIKLPFHFYINHTVEIFDQKKEVDKLQMQRRLMHSMAEGAKNVRDLESETALSDVEELIQELLDGSERIVTCGLSITIWGNKRKELEEKTETVLKAFRSMNQSEGIVETLASLDAHIKSLPGSATSLRSQKMKSSNAAHLAPIFSYWEGNQKPVCLIPNREMMLVKIDPFAPELPAWNAITIGGTGSGKSFAINQLMLQFAAQTSPKPKIVWIDNGESCRGVVEALNGSFINVGLDSNISLNMLDLAPGENKPSPQRTLLILAILEVMLRDNASSALPKRSKALLEECIHQHIGDAHYRLKQSVCSIHVNPHLVFVFPSFKNLLSCLMVPVGAASTV